MLFDANRGLKLIDFGLVAMPFQDPIKTSCGSANYACTSSHVANSLAAVACSPFAAHMPSITVLNPDCVYPMNPHSPRSHCG
jgi:hypothetical protein